MSAAWTRTHLDPYWTEHRVAGPIGADSESDSLEIPRSADKNIHIAGTFGGATVTVRGSNNGISYVTLKDYGYTAMSLTTEDILQFVSSPRFIKVVVTGGDGSTAITASLLSRI